MHAIFQPIDWPLSMVYILVAEFFFFFFFFFSQADPDSLPGAPFIQQCCLFTFVDSFFLQFNYKWSVDRVY